MPLAKLTCPHCRATLKPAKPVPEGKTVKCPKCEKTFKAGENGAAPPADAPAAKAEAPAASPPVSKKYGAKQYDEAEEESGGTYAVAKDEDADRKKAEAERKKKKKKKRADDEDEDEEEEDNDDPTAQYLKNLKVTDPRGPAQVIIVPPANWLLRTALIGFFGWVFYFGVFMLPIAFPNRGEKSDTAKGSQAAGDKKGKPKLTDDDIKDIRADGVSDAGMRKIEALRGKEFESIDQLTSEALKGLDKDDIAIVKKNKKFTSGKKDKYQHWWSAETILDEETRAWSVPLFVFLLLLGIAQAGAIAVASVKMQSLENYNWSRIGCILAIVPLTTFPLFVLLTATLDLLDSGLEAGWADFTWVIALVAFLWGPIVGGLCLKEFMRPEVKPGYEYKPE